MSLEGLRNDERMIRLLSGAWMGTLAVKTVSDLTLPTPFDKYEVSVASGIAYAPHNVSRKGLMPVMHVDDLWKDDAPRIPEDSSARLLECARLLELAFQCHYISGTKASHDAGCVVDLLQQQAAQRFAMNQPPDVLADRLRERTRGNPMRAGGTFQYSHIEKISEENLDPDLSAYRYSIFLSIHHDWHTNPHLDQWLALLDGLEAEEGESQKFRKYLENRDTADVDEPKLERYAILELGAMCFVSYLSTLFDRMGPSLSTDFASLYKYWLDRFFGTPLIAAGTLGFKVPVASFEPNWSTALSKSGMFDELGATDPAVKREDTPLYSLARVWNTLHRSVNGEVTATIANPYLRIRPDEDLER